MLEDVYLSLHDIEYDASSDSYKAKYTRFGIVGNKGDVFEFNAIFTEGIPQNLLYLVGQTELCVAYYLLQESGIDGLPNGLVVKGASVMP